MASVQRFVVLCLCLSVCAEATRTQTCDVTDDVALQTFVGDIVYPVSEFQTWIPGTNCCAWKGVKCDGSGKVVSLTIENIDQKAPHPKGPLYLVGTSLLDLKNLASLTMKNVPFNGGIPPSWGTLNNLKVLSLESCNIVGPLPKELCDLKGITTFDLFDNLLNGNLPACYSTPFTTFPHHQVFNISGNDFS